MRRRESCGSAKQGGTTGRRSGRGPGDCMEFGEIRHWCVLMKTSGDGRAQPVGSDTLVLK